MTLKISVIYFYVLMFVYLTEAANVVYFGILMCKLKCCKMRTCEHIYYSRQTLVCHLVGQAFNNKSDKLKCEKITCDSSNPSQEETLSQQQHNRRCPCLTLLTANQTFPRFPESTAPGTLQPVMDKTGQHSFPADVKQVICEPPVIAVPMEFDPESVHRKCSLVDGLLGRNTPWRRRQSENIRSKLRRVQGARSYRDFSSNGTGSQWFGVKISIGRWQYDRSNIPFLQLFFCLAWFTDRKPYLIQNRWCSGFGLSVYDGMVYVTPHCPGSGHQYKHAGSIEMKESYDFAVVIRREQHELVLLDMVGKRVIGKCGSLKIEEVSKFVVQLNDRFPVSVEFKSLHTDELCT